MKIFKKSKKFKKLKAKNRAIYDLQKENEHLRSKLKVKEQEVDRALDILTKITE